MEFAKKFNFEEKEEKQSQPFENYELLKNPSLFCETDLGVNKKLKKTSIMAVVYDKGVLLGADSRTTSVTKY